MDWLDAERVLVVRADNIGDVLMSAPALAALRAALPHAAITLLASPAGSQAAPLLPWIDDVWTERVLWQDLGRLRFDPARERRFVDVLRARRFDAAIVLTSFSQSPYPAAFVAWLAGIPLRAGASREASALLTHRAPFLSVAAHQVERNLALIEALGIPVRSRALALRVPDDARASVRALLAARGVRAGEPYVLLSPWATAAARTYDPARSAAAAAIVAAATGWPVVVTATVHEAERASVLARTLGDAALDVSGRTSVPELAALVEAAKLVITNNSAAMHMADAFGSPACVVYSGTELESQWAPRRTPHVLLRKPTECTPCYAFECPYGHECVDFTAEEVADAALSLLTAAAAAADRSGCPAAPPSSHLAARAPSDVYDA